MGKKCISLVSTIVVLTLAFMVQLALPAVSANALENNSVEDAQNGVVRVFCDVNEVEFSTGTGFAVGIPGEEAQYFVTNYHVIEDNQDAVFISITDIYGKIDAEILSYDVNADVAILKIKTPLAERTPLRLMLPSNLHKSQDIFCLGFPGAADAFSDNQNWGSDIEDITITKGTVSNPTYSSGGISSIMTDAVINPGNSGGPMTDENGHVVGINTWGIDGANMNVAVGIQYAIELLEDLGIEYAMYELEERSDNDRMDDDEEPVKDDHGEDAGEEKKDIGKSTKILLFLVGVAILLAAGIVVFVVLHKKKKTFITNEEMSAVTTGITGQMLILCESGALAGQHRVSVGRVTIGRDPACDFSFPANTPGISRFHCELQLTGAGILLTDNGSSYGTFLQNGIKLQPHVPTVLSDEGRFYLASSAVSFAVQIQR